MGKKSSDYEEQDRGDASSYERYLQGMDQSMRQKVALTAAHLLGEGRVADMGMGSGSGTLALASLYPRVQVIGVDVNPKMVERARTIHRRPNLEFALGDIAAPVFKDSSLDCIFNSSVLHHVTSFSDYDHQAAARALSVQCAGLAPGGSLVVRDFVSPPEGTVLLDVRGDDACPTANESDASPLSSADLLRRFSSEFRKLSPAPGFRLEEMGAKDAAPKVSPGFVRFKLERRMAAEFLLRKDYRRDWETEVLEEYTYFTQEEFEEEFRRLGLRLLASFPVHNPWIVKNRFEGKAALWSLDGEPLPLPATNHLIVGEKAPPGEGVEFSAGDDAEPLHFLHRHSFALRDGSGTRQLVRRPGTALDIVPWFRDSGNLFILARKGHPRPILCTQSESHSLDGAAAIAYVTEPILVLQSEMPIALTVESTLGQVAGILPESVLQMREAAHYYPSPGGIVEEARAVHVQIEASYVQDAVENKTGYSTSGTVRAIFAQQLLRAAQVGALPDVRLELNVYEILNREGETAGPWIGATASLLEPAGPPALPFSEQELPARRAYVPTSAREDDSFLTIRARLFTELGAGGQTLYEHVREYAEPRELSINTMSTILVRLHAGEILIALDEDDLAAAQCFSGSSRMWVTPAWRLAKTVANLEEGRSFVAGRLQDTYGVQTGTMTELGGRYHPSAGITPEVVYPQLVSVSHLAPEGKRPLLWIRLAELRDSIHRIQDGHLRIGALRAAHALGLLT